MKTRITRRIAGGLTALSLAGGAAVALAQPATAIPTGDLKVCAHPNSNYSAYVVLPKRGGLATALVAPGKCMTFQDLGSFGSERVVVRGSGQGRSFTIGSFTRDFDKRGADILTFGSAANPHYRTFV